MNPHLEHYKNKLFDNGFINVNLKDLYPTYYYDSLKSINKFSKINNINMLQLDANIPNQYSLDYLKGLYKEHNDIKFDDSIKLGESRGQKDLKLVYKLVSENPQYEFLKQIKIKLHEIINYNFQSWMEYTIHSADESHDIVHQIYSRLYLDFYNTKLPEHFGCRFTCFEKDDLIVSHRDSDDTSNKCVILIYLNDDYEEGCGGELIIENKEIVKPIFGQISILDFTKHNVIHQVTKINGDFKRCALIQFL